ncbi:uncharacterized protein LOC112566928 [Pomacea canaliculata]|uniref:uncharacterized protein LOC112566928 n=1 Tax=Pomacea canaliculata TaxID=400727 RepID=UPI000D7335D4|nr:uncharacterized protein LOC112566928 [Pomacea canaliculata]
MLANATEESRVLNTIRAQTYDTDTVVSREIYTTFRLIFVGFLALVLAILGISTNVVNCLVFQRQGLGDRMNLCLFCLALADLGLLLFVFPFSMITIFCDLGLFGVTEEHYFKTSLYSLGIVYAFRTTSGCYNMVIAVERCVCVLFPLRAVSLIRTRTMGIILASIAVTLQVGFLTLPFRHQLVRLDMDGKVVWYLGLSAAWAANQKLFDIIFSHILSVILPLVTFHVVSIATLVTVVKLRVAMAWREKTSSAGTTNDSQMALTKTLVLVSCVYIVTTLPLVGSKLVSVVSSDFSVLGRYLMLYNLITYVANVFPLINSFVHFFVYYSRSSRFRRELTLLCLQLKTRRKILSNRRNVGFKK